jgi:Leucine-rich repeat (LRR) protein
VLWLADNHISCVAGLEHLGQLQQLNLARNDIRSIAGSSLAAATALTSLNVADNPIGSLQVPQRGRRCCAMHAVTLAAARPA